VITGDTVAVNWVLLDPAATVTLPGTVTLLPLSDSVTANPPAGAEPLSVTVHNDAPGVFTLPGVQDRLLKVTGGGGWVTVIAPPVPEAGMGFAAAPAVEMPLRIIGTLVLLVPGAIVKAAVATWPLPSVVVLRPKMMQVVEPSPSAHCRTFPAAEAAEPIVTATLVMSEEYPMVH
jgi:hypothetical protein